MFLRFWCLLSKSLEKLMEEEGVSTGGNRSLPVMAMAAMAVEDLMEGEGGRLSNPVNSLEEESCFGRLRVLSV
jgi:hypothetical protein